ncbi:IclR family transcriptional regulator [Pelagibius sp.]|uniref:IclR family transcriptional regulator n=1 Tax=Pelagibius sp. TaxID=1931238 RepID=UPI003BB16838
MADDRVAAVERALTILEAFAEGAGELSLAELAARTGFYKSTILRLIASLERFGYILRTPAGRYRLGPSLARLGVLYRDERNLEPILRPALRRLRDDSGETASLYVGSGLTRTCLYRENSVRELRHHLEEGARLPLALGAAGKVLRAYADEADETLRRVRRDGYALSLGERDPNIAAVAVPLLDGTGRLLGALCLSGLAAQFTLGHQRRCRDLLLEAAAVLQNTV